MSIELISKIEPKNSGSFPMLEDVHLEGGLQVRTDITDRDSIPTLNRKEGMLVYVVSTSLTYRLGPGLTNADWALETAPPFFATLTAGENLALGELVRINSSGEIIKADAGSISDSRVIGPSIGAFTSGGSAQVSTQFGAISQVKFGSAPAGASNGSPVYLSDSVPGEATLTPPSSSGSVIFMVGILQGANGITSTPNVLIQPKLVSVIG